jgi:integrase
MVKKRGNGEGSIYRCKDRPGYRAAYTVQTARGTRRCYVSGKTRREVEEKLTKAKAERDGGLVFDSDSGRLGPYLEGWLDDVVRNTVKQRTLENYAYIVQRHITPELGRVKVKDLRPDWVRRLYREKLDSGLSTRTVRLVHTVLNKALKQAVLDGVLARNVCVAVKAPRLVKKEIRPLDPIQAGTLLEVAKGDRLEALYVLAITAGLREGELLGLRWEDVALQHGTVQVRRQLTRTKKYGISFTTPKRGKSRSVKLAERAVKALKNHRERQSEELLRLGTPSQNNNLVFTSTVGTPLDPSNFTYHTFRPFLKRAGLPKIRFHDLRHTCATLLLGKGVHPKIVQQMLGHANISETMDTYSHVLPNMQEAAAASAMETILR